MEQDQDDFFVVMYSDEVRRYVVQGKDGRKVAFLGKKDDADQKASGLNSEYRQRQIDMSRKHTADRWMNAEFNGDEVSLILEGKTQFVVDRAGLDEKRAKDVVSKARRQKTFETSGNQFDLLTDTSRRRLHFYNSPEAVLKSLLVGNLEKDAGIGRVVMAEIIWWLARVNPSITIDAREAIVISRKFGK